ncbi:Transient receptor potential cation channel subfamily A member 1 [Paramuricea clavata]|uniref:Transient receptor potential cation channel subfamily A member 1 n=1 Tax=Paramuricea clavata TaxID=317549 RepID=A0A7D9HR34_PARCT|nr:Transient receptor potential cation channel subfamily A member 1 [Paramuricea clavata]
MDLIAMYPNDYEVDNSDINNHPTYSTSLRKFFHAIKNYLQQFKHKTTAEDLNCVSGLTTECKFAAYEEVRLKHLVEHITKSLLFFENCTLCNAERNLATSRFVPSVVSITDKTRQLIIVLQTDVEKEFLKRPTNLTDAGPGVAVSNGDVRVHDAEMAMFLGSDWRCRCHRDRRDSCQNEAERTNSALGDAIADGGTIEWEYYEQFHDLTDEQVQNLSLKEYTEHEEARMKKNAWKVAVNVKIRLDDAPVLKEFVKAHLTKPEDKQYFFNKDNLKQYLNAQSEEKTSVPGHGYMETGKEFYDMHYQTGELSS